MSKNPDKAPAADASKDAKAPKAGAAAKPEKKGGKKTEKGLYTMYKVEGDKATRLRPTCERCGPGYFMADHHDRFTCGHCGFTRYKRA